MRSTVATAFRLAVGLCAVLWAQATRGDDADRIVLPAALQTPETNPARKPPEKKSAEQRIPEASNETPLPRLPLPTPDRSPRPQESKAKDPPPASANRPMQPPENSTGKKAAEKKAAPPNVPEASNEMTLPRLPSLEPDRSPRPPEPKKQEPPEASKAPLDGDSLISKIPKGTNVPGPASTEVIAPLDVFESDDEMWPQPESVSFRRTWPTILDT